MGVEPVRQRLRRMRRFPLYQKNALFRTVAVVLVVSIALLLLDARLRPAIRAVAVLQAKALAVATVNQTVTDVLTQNAPQYGDLVNLATDSAGNISSITTDIVKMNLLKSQLTLGIDEHIAQVQQRRLAVPLGSVLGLDVLSARGPKLSVNLSMTGETNAVFEHSFDSAGINQTRHRIMLFVESTVYVILPGNRSYETIKTNFCVAETIIVGAVPELMTRLNPAQQP